MKNILVLFTGGTIGSTATEGTIDISGGTPFKLLQLFQQQTPKHQNINFTTRQPLQILSENLAPPAWKILIAALEAEHIDQYDGVIITHGTDTLAYTASALSFYFNNLNVPILLVSSDYPLDDPRANGLTNFSCAIEFILQKIQSGVFVPYRNQQQKKTLVHKAARLTCSLQLTGDFYSVQGNSFAQFENKRFSGLPVTTAPDATISTSTSPSISARFCSRILMIKPYPGLDYSHFNLELVDVILHDLYHSGTACTSTQWGENHSLLSFIKRCNEKNIPVYLAPATQATNAYHSTRALLDLGAEMIWNMSIESAYIKLMLAYGNFNNKQQILAYLNQDSAGEHV
jgi:L-asparaginase